MSKESTARRRARRHPETSAASPSIGRNQTAAFERVTNTSKKKTGRWVALMTFVHERDTARDLFYEAGGVYDHEPRCKWTKGGRPFEPGEHVAVCSRCGHEFATTDGPEGESAEEARDMHFAVYGDEDMPSICGDLPPAVTE